MTLQWRHNGRDSISDHQPHDCLPKRLLRRRSKKASKLRVTGLCAGNSLVTGEFPAQRWKMFPFGDVIMKVNRIHVRMTQHHQGFRGLAGVSIGIQIHWKRYDMMSEYGKNDIKKWKPHLISTRTLLSILQIYHNVQQPRENHSDVSSIGPTVAQLWLAVAHLITYKNSKIGRYGIDIK